MWGPAQNSSPLGRSTASACQSFEAARETRRASQSNFTIYDDEDQISLIKQALEAVDLDSKRFHPRAVLSSISRSKSHMVDSHALEQNQLSYFEDQVAKVYRQYDEMLSRNNAVDFDDLLMKTAVLLRDYPDVLKRYQRRYQHVLIDEFQDTTIAPVFPCPAACPGEPEHLRGRGRRPVHLFLASRRHTQHAQLPERLPRCQDR